MAYILKETSKLIDFKGRIFIINTLLLSVIFMTINFFGTVRYNVINVQEYLKNNQQIRILLREGVSEETVKQFEEELSNDKKIAYHAYGAKELTVKSLERKINLDITKNNTIRDHITIFFGDVKDISEVETYVAELEKREFTEKVLFNKEMFQTLMNTENTFKFIANGVLGFFIVPLYLVVFLIFKLNFVNYEDELFEKVTFVKNGLKVITPYFLKKLINILIAWCISYTIFSVFYTKVESLLLVLNPNINFVIFENLPKLLFLNQIGIAIGLLLLAIFFIRKKGGNKR